LMPTKVARQVAVLESSEFRDAPCCHCFGTISSHTGSEGRNGRPNADHGRDAFVEDSVPGRYMFCRR
jgi:hypothetical protein